MRVVAGAPSGPALRAAVEETLGAPLLDAEGSTETCGMVAVNRPEGPRVDGSCGPPVPGTDVRVVDPRSGGDVPDGAEDEVWVRGPSPMRTNGPTFWKARKITGVATTELEAFVELECGLASGDASLTEAAGPAGERLPAVADDIERAVRRLPDADDLRNPLYESESFRQVFQEGPSHRNAGVFGWPLESEALLRPGGLVASEDGPAWVEPEGR